MISRILKSGYVAYTSDGNKMVRLLIRIPFLRKKMADCSEKTADILGVIYRLIAEFVKKLIYCAVFLLIPNILFAKYMKAGENGFGLEDCFVYFAVVMNCFCGSIMNSVVFKKSKYSYTALYDCKVNPADYYRFAMLRRAGIELIAFWGAFSVLGMNPAKAFYLAIIIIAARSVGETINILLYRFTKKTFSEINGANVVLMLISLFMAYYIPYVRGHVPGAYDLIFDTLWLAVILIIGAVFIYYVFTYRHYRKIAEAVFADLGEFETDDAKLSVKVAPGAVTDIINEQLDAGEFDYEAINETFFMENKHDIAKLFIKKTALAAILLVASIVGVKVGDREFLYKVLTLLMPIITCVVYIFSSSDRICREMYYQCDTQLLDYKNFRRPDDILQNFFIRLRYLIALDLVPDILIMIATVIIAVGAKGTSTAQVTLSVALGVIMLSVLFTFVNLFVYYVVMPYKKDYNQSNKSTSIMTFAVCIVCAVLVYFDITAFEYALGVGLLTGLFIAFSTTMVMLKGPKTYRNK